MIDILTMHSRKNSSEQTRLAERASDFRELMFSA